MSGTGRGDLSDPLPYSEVSKFISPAIVAPYPNSAGPAFTEAIPGDNGPVGQALSIPLVGGMKMRGKKMRKFKKSKKSKKSKKNHTRKMKKGGR
jgi:hypothetical protein